MICDDEKIYRDAIKKEILAVANNYDHIPEIFEVDDGFEVLKYLERYNIDVLFIDIEMNKLNGLRTAMEIRKKDENMIIIFITAHESFALQSYEVQAFDYLLKNKLDQLPKKYERLMQVIMNRFKNENATILLGNKADLKKVFIKDIIYVEVEGHRTLIHTEEGIIAHVEKISAIEALLIPHDFIRSHQSFIVNLDKVDGIQQNGGIQYFEMESGQLIEISRRRKKTAMDAFFLFIRRQ